MKCNKCGTPLAWCLIIEQRTICEECRAKLYGFPDREADRERFADDFMTPEEMAGMCRVPIGSFSE